VTQRYNQAKDMSASQLMRRISDDVRAERTRLKLSQREFAQRCSIPLRTYKRFELGECDSLSVFIQIVKTFGRTLAFGLFFEPKNQELNIRTPVAALERLKKKYDAQK